MKIVILALVLSAAAWSQGTSIIIGQVGGCSPGAIAVAVQVGSIGVVPVVRFVCGILDPASLALDTTKTPPVLRALAVAAPGTAFVDHETPSGPVDSQNVIFVLAATPSAGSEHLWRNGILQKPGFDYSIVGKTITFLPGIIPQVGDTLQVDYRK